MSWCLMLRLDYLTMVVLCAFNFYSHQGYGLKKSLSFTSDTRGPNWGDEGGFTATRKNMGLKDTSCCFVLSGGDFMALNNKS